MKTITHPSSLSDSAAVRLRREILGGLVAPGNLLAESAVAQRLGVSRVPVREALFALEREGLVEFSATGRAFVRELTLQDFEELYTLRLTLEPLAARLAAPMLKAEAVLLERNIAATRRAKSVQDVTRLDLEFHEIILGASGNARLLKVWRSLRGELELWLGRLHQQHQRQRLDTRDETAVEHTKIVECFKTHSPAECERLMRRHILGWREWLPAMEVNEKPIMNIESMNPPPKQRHVRLLNGKRGLLLLCFIPLLAAHALADESRTFEQIGQPFLKEHCLRCHDAEKQKGDFRLDTLSRDFADRAVAERWAEVMFRINAGEMPPKKEPQPTAETLGQVAGWISSRLDEGRALRMARRAPVEHYRLSNDEYVNTLDDLLGVRYDVRTPGNFNDEPRWHGFERIGSMLTLSPSHGDKYLKAVEAVLERAFPEVPIKSQKLKGNFVDTYFYFNSLKKQQEKVQADLGISERAPRQRVLWPERKIIAIQPLPAPGKYRIRIQLSAMTPAQGRTPHLVFWHANLHYAIFEQDVLAPEDQPIIVEFEAELMPTTMEVALEVPPLRGDNSHAHLPTLQDIFTDTKNSRTLDPSALKMFDDNGQAIYPILLLDWGEFEGPLTSEADLKKRAGLVPAKDGDLVEARACLQRLATRAWRRPVTDTEVSRYVKLLETELAAGEKFRAAYRTAMVGVLISKNFYYLEEGSATEQRDTVNDWELASRLSYFLWGSMPDEELFALAQASKLHEPEVLRGQVARMFGDVKIKRFTEAFPRQWLQLHRVGMFPPSPKLYGDYDLWLERSMVMESVAYFTEMFTKNLPLREFLASDWTMVNPRLAEHYQLPPLKGTAFQRVTLRPQDHRGGLLTQASILSLTSDGTRHRPVHRGVWVSEAIFGKTPPPPPPNVEPIEPTPSDKPKATVRMQLEAHATNATCASCHAKIDPLGFAFDNFDAIGRWRTHEQAATGQGDNPPVNATGTLPDGRAYNGPDEFKRLLAQDTDRFAHAFVEQLATFALRRVMTLDDAAQLKAIAQSGKADDYKLRTVIENLVTSDLFQKR